MTRVLVVDDHAAIRAGLRSLLDTATGIEVIGEAADGDAAIDLARSLRPDVVLMDIRMPGTDGIAATTEIARDNLAAVLVLTSFDIDEYIFAALRAGASGFLLKTADADELIDAIEAVARGDAVLAPQVTRTVIERFSTGNQPVAVESRSSATVLDQLTEREREILGCLGDGLSNAQIARTLYIGETTVKTHVSRVLAKLGLQSRVQAAIVARDHGLGTINRM